MRRTYSLLKEPVDDIYREIIVYAVKYCYSFLLVVRHTIPQNDSVKEAIEKFRPYLLNKGEKLEWPGTKLIKGRATVYQFQFNQDTASLLGKTTKSLYSWLQPNLPEDLSLIRSDGTPWLVTIAHEKDAYMELTNTEKNTIVKVIPDLVLA